MQVEMSGTGEVKARRRSEVDDLVARIGQAVEQSRELRRQTNQVTEEALRDIREGLAQLRRELRRVSYY